MSGEKADDRDSRYRTSIGRWVSPATLAEIAEFCSDAHRREWFAKRDTVPFWYERFDKEGLTDKLSVIADEWVGSEENIKRAALQVNRPPKPATKELVLAFGVYKFKQHGRWELVHHPARYHKESAGQTMVCIALENLGPDNGFPFQLQRGQDVCIDGNDNLLLPPTGGGLAILIWIDL